MLSNLLSNGINVQGLNVQSTSASSNAGYSAINQSNDLIPNLGVPSATWTSSVGQSDYPNVPNALVFEATLNNPLSPNIGVLGLFATGGSDTGNGSQIFTSGDLNVNGDIITPIISASTLGTDAITQWSQLIRSPANGE